MKLTAASVCELQQLKFTKNWSDIARSCPIVLFVTCCIATPTCQKKLVDSQVWTTSKHYNTRHTSYGVYSFGFSSQQSKSLRLSQCLSPTSHPLESFTSINLPTKWTLAKVGNLTVQWPYYSIFSECAQCTSMATLLLTCAHTLLECYQCGWETWPYTSEHESYTTKE